MALTGKRHRIGQRVDPLRRKPGVFRLSLPGFDDRGGQCQIAIDQIGLVLQSGKVDLKLQIGCGSPFGVSRFRFEAQFSPGHFVAAWRKELRHKMAVTKRAPWGRGVRRAHREVNGEALQIAGVAVHIQLKFRRRRETDAIERIRELSQPILQRAPWSRLGCGEHFPVADRRGVGDQAGQLKIGSMKDGMKMIQRPLIVGQQAQVGLNVIDGEQPWWSIGLTDWPNQAAVVQCERIGLQFQSGQELVIDRKVELGQRELRAERLVGLAETDIFGHNALVPAKP